MTARGALGRQKEQGRSTVSIEEGGNPEEQRQPPWACTQQQDGSSLPVTLGLAPRIQSVNNINNSRACPGIQLLNK